MSADRKAQMGADKKKTGGRGIQKEKRKFVRLKKCVDVAYVSLTTMRAPFNSLTRDIGGGGICVYPKEAIKKGEVLELEMRLPGKKPIFAIGKAAWIKGKPGKQEAGIEFVAIRAKDKARCTQMRADDRRRR